MGASHEVGRNESCIWGFALPAVVQSIHRPASAAPVAVDPWSPWRIWVFCLIGRQTNGAQQHLTVSKARFLVCPSWPELRWTSPPWGCPWCVGNGETGWSSGTQAHHNPQGKFIFELAHADVDPTPLVCASMLNNLNIVSNMTSVLFFCVFLGKACSM